MRASSARARAFVLCCFRSRYWALRQSRRRRYSVISGSVALLVDLIHNFGDALTAVPLGIAFWLRSDLAERRAGLAVVAAIFISACVAGVEAVLRLVHPSAPTHLITLALAGLIGFSG